MANEKYLDFLLRRYGEAAQPIATVRAIVQDQLAGSAVEVYYPGIGGTGEPLDFIWPFHWLDANSVHGIDLFSQRHGDLLNASFPYCTDFESRFELLQRQLNQDVTPVSSQETDSHWQGSFCLDGTNRQITVAKASIDATVFIPLKPYPVIFSRRTNGVLNNIPEGVIREVQIIFFEAERESEARKVTDYLCLKGFRTADAGIKAPTFRLFTRS